jgi:hypothetical protein
MHNAAWHITQAQGYSAAWRRTEPIRPITTCATLVRQA